MSLFSNNNIELCISDDLFEEYYDVLNREKFSKYLNFSAKAQTLLVDIQKRATKYFPTINLKIINDNDNNKLLELAETCNANFIVTGNTNDFTIKEYNGNKNCNTKRVLGNVSNAITQAYSLTIIFERLHH